jgi:hypothetical protein
VPGITEAKSINKEFTSMAKKTNTAKTAPKGKTPAKPTAAKPAEAKGETMAIHVNKTGRVCFGKDAAARLGDAKFCAMAIDKGLVRLTPTNKATPDALPIRKASGRPYISATRQFKPLGFDGSDPINVQAKPYGAAGFEFRLI